MPLRAALVVVLLVTAGCTHLHIDRIPEPLRPQATPVTEADIEARSYKLQIIITRQPVYFSHAALRLIDNRRTLFWDPAGGYGATENYPEFYRRYPLAEDFNRQNDVIVAGAPGLRRYWAYSKHAGDNGMEVLEWNLSEAQAARYYDVLIKGARGQTDIHGFATKRHFLLCSSNLTRFLVRFADDSVGLKETYFFPDNLAHALYELHPDRVILFDADNGVRIFAEAE